MKIYTKFVTAAALAIGLATAIQTQTASAMNDKTPMGGMMGGKMSMSDKKMMPMMGKGMSMSHKSMMMKMMPMMSASDKKTMMGMSEAEKKVCMNMCAKMESMMAMSAKKQAAHHPTGKTPMGKTPMGQKPATKPMEGMSSGSQSSMAHK